MVTQFIYEHMVIYMNLTSNITKGQKRVQRGKKKKSKLKSP